VHSRRIQTTLFAVTISLLLAGLLAATAGATVTASQISSPSDPTLLPLLVYPLSGPAAETLSVSGTAETNDGDASDSVELGCFYDSTSGSQEEIVVKNLDNDPRDAHGARGRRVQHE
jgi:hypothetical protein